MKFPLPTSQSLLAATVIWSVEPSNKSDAVPNFLIAVSSWALPDAIIVLPDSSVIVVDPSAPSKWINDFV